MICGIYLIFSVSQFSNQLLGYFGAFSFIFVALIWNTRYFAAGMIFMTPRNTICNIIGGIVNFVMGVWNDIVGPVIGAAIEAVKSVVNVLIGQIINVLVTPILTTNLYNENPTMLTPINDTSTIQLKSDLSIQSSDSLNGLLSNIDNLVNNPYIPSFQLPIPLDGALGDLLKMSGPAILEELFKQLANTIVSQVFIGILGLDKIIITQQNLIDIIQAFTGCSISDLETMFNIDINQALNDPTIIVGPFSNLFSKLNPSAVDFNNNSSTINTMGFGKYVKAVFNVGESLNHGLASIMNINTNTNTNTNNAKENTKTAIELEFTMFMVSDMMNQLATVAITNTDPHYPDDVIFFEFIKLILSIDTFGLSTES